MSYRGTFFAQQSCWLRSLKATTVAPGQHWVGLHKTYKLHCGLVNSRQWTCLECSLKTMVNRNNTTDWTDQLWVTEAWVNRRLMMNYWPADLIICAHGWQNFDIWGVKYSPDSSDCIWMWVKARVAKDVYLTNNTWHFFMYRVELLVFEVMRSHDVCKKHPKQC